MAFQPSFHELACLLTLGSRFFFLPKMRIVFVIQFNLLTSQPPHSTQFILRLNRLLKNRTHSNYGTLLWKIITIIVGHNLKIEMNTELFITFRVFQMFGNLKQALL